MEQNRVPVLPQQAGVHRLSSIEKQVLIIFLLVLPSPSTGSASLSV